MMKLLLLLIILPMSIIPVFAEGELQIQIEKDVEFPTIGDTITIIITNLEPSTFVDFYIVSEKDIPFYTFGYLLSSEKDEDIYHWEFPKYFPYGNYTVIITNNDRSVQANFTHEVPDTGPVIINIENYNTIYYKSESIYITGTVSEKIEDEVISIYIVKPNHGFAEYDYFEIDNDGSFNIEFDIDENWDILGMYNLTARYWTDILELSFEVFPNKLDFQTDKSEYYTKENIFVTGTMNNTEWSDNIIINYTIEDMFGTILKSENNVTLQNDNSFNFMINTANDITFDNISDDILLTINIQNSTTSTVFYYSDNPDSSNETLYDMISTQDLRITNNEDMIVQHDTLITEINNSTIHNIQEQLSSLSLDQSSMAQEITGIKNSMGGSPPEESIHPEITNFAGNSIGNETINLSWEITGEPITSYNLIYRYEQSNWDSDDTIHVNATTYIMNNLENEDYEIKLSATNEHGTSKIAKLIINPVTVGFFTDTSTDFNTNNESTHYTVTEHTSIDDLYKLIESQNITISNQQDQIDAFLQGLTILAESMRDYHK